MHCLLRSQERKPRLDDSSGPFHDGWVGADMVEGVWHPEGPPASGELSALREAAPAVLPLSYFAQLESSNGGEGSLAIQPCWVSFWPAGDVLHLNREYGVHEYLEGFFGFGSNGAGELLAFDLRGPTPPRVVMVPFIGMNPAEAIIVATSFESFRQAIGA
jgi:hypothetical protein